VNKLPGWLRWLGQFFRAEPPTSISAAALDRQVSALPDSQDAYAVRAFLQRLGQESQTLTLEHPLAWARAFMLEQMKLTASKVKTYGIPATIISLQGQPRQKQILKASFVNDGWRGLFFLNDRGKLIGFILLPMPESRGREVEPPSELGKPDAVGKDD
jgi:hypothetical protein